MSGPGAASSRRIERSLVQAAFLLALGAALLGSPEVGGGRLSPELLLAAALQGEGEIGALELGGWLLPENGAVRVIDLRDAEAFAGSSIPESEHMELAHLGDLIVARGETVVLVGSAEQVSWGWAVLRARGVDAFRLKGGYAGWKADLLEAVLPLDASVEERERFTSVAELSRHFGGEPQVSVMALGGWTELLAAPEGGRAELDAFIRSVSRKGCGFR